MKIIIERTREIITAVDIWQEVLEENGYSFYDEKSRAGDDTTILEFFKGFLKCSVYTNYKTGEVSNVFFNETERPKEEFIKEFKIKVRDYKLTSILD